MSNSCCEGFSATFEDLEFKDRLPETVRKQIRMYDKSFATSDRRILYFVSFGLIVNAITVLFILGSMDTNDYINKIIVAECLFLMVFALLITIIRVWIFKYNMLQPIIGLWRQLHGQSIGKWMFFFSLLFVFGAIILMSIVVFLLGNNNYGMGIGLTCLDCSLFMMALVFFRLHVSSYIQMAKTIDLPVSYDAIV